MNTRTILLWHNNGAERIYLTVNPESISISRPNTNRALPLAMGGTINAWGGRGLREVKFSTFLPDIHSPFFNGADPQAVLAKLCRWQDTGDPIRLIISDSDINDAFLIEDVTETLREGDMDIGLILTLREYKFKSALAALAGSSTAQGRIAREDDRILPKTYTVKKGDTLWGIATSFYGDGTKWVLLAENNSITNPRTLPVGKVLTL